MSKHAPDKSLGGTFHYDAKGNFLHHTPATRPPDDTTWPPGDSLNPDPTKPVLSPDPGSHIDPPPTQPTQPAHKRVKE